MQFSTMTPAEQAFYTAQSATSDPGEFAKLVATLPADPRHVVGVVSGLLLHPVFLARRRVDHPQAQGSDAEVRPARELLRRIIERDARPLGVARPYERRVIGTCRHYALLAATILRHHGLPSRLRVGFATYFVRGFHEDHWLCEYWDGQVWRLLDAELDNEAIAKEYTIDFPPSDVPRDCFLSAGEAWRGLRRGTIDGERCGVSFIPAVRGAWFVGASILRDLAALNTRELLPWDYWGLARTFSGPGASIPPAAAVRLDEIAALTAGPAPEWQALRATYEAADDLRVPPTVLSFPGGKPVEVRV